MARIRSLHPGFFTDEAVVSLSPLARILYMGLWTESDDRGVFEWKPITLKMRLLPAENCQIAPLLVEISESGLIRKFEDDGKSYGAIRKFCKWQRPKSPQHLHPCPSDVLEFVYFDEVAEAEASSTRGTALGRILCERQDNACYYCDAAITFYRKKANSVEVDHRIPISRGGDDDLSNLVGACKSCNSLKGSMTESEFVARYSRGELAAKSRERMASAAAKGMARHATAPPSERQDANSQVSQTIFPPKAEIHPQMEDGGGRMEDGGDSSVSSVAIATSSPGAPPVAPPPKVASPNGQEGEGEFPLNLVRAPDGDWSYPLFRQGLSWLAHTTGHHSPEKLRPLIGKWLKAAGGDHRRVFELMARAETEAVADPKAWITANLGMKAPGVPGPGEFSTVRMLQGMFDAANSREDNPVGADPAADNALPPPEADRDRGPGQPLPRRARAQRRGGND